MKQKFLLIKVSTILLLSSALFGLWVPKTAHAEDIVDITRAAGYTVNEIYRPKASIIIDAATGSVLWEDNPDLPWSPASTTKMMTVYLAFEAMKQGKFTLDTTITATEADAKISQIHALSNNKIVAGVAYPIRELLSMIIVPSSNVATVMVANLISDNDEAGFVKMMNDKCAELGMTNSIFYNCSGAQISAFQGYYAPIGIDPNADNQSSARDLSIMTYNMLNKYPEVLEFTKSPVVTVMAGTPYAETFDTYNHSLEGAMYSFKGMDGLKTGSSPTANFNYIGTAKRGETRFIEVILGAGNWADQAGEHERHPFGNAILERAFATYEYKKVLSKGKNDIDGNEISLDADLYGVVQKGSTPKFNLANHKVTLDNGLAQVSDKIPPLAVDFTESILSQQSNSPKTAKKITKKTATATTATPVIEYVFSAMVAILGGIFMVLTPMTKRPIKGRRARHSPGMRPLFLLGLILLAGGITLAVLSWQLGAWFPFSF